jgi:hypothetical protein
MLTAGADSVGRAGANNYRMKFGYVTVSTHGQSIDAEWRQHLGGRGKKQGCEGDSVKSYARLHILFEHFEHELEKGQYLLKTFSEFCRQAAQEKTRCLRENTGSQVGGLHSPREP